MPPSPTRLPLVVETLVVADAAYGTVIEIQKLATEGRQADALALLALLAEGMAAHRPIIRGVLAAERQSTEMRDASERTASTIAKIIRHPAHEELNAANDIAQSPSPNPSQPAA